MKKKKEMEWKEMRGACGSVWKKKTKYKYGANWCMLEVSVECG